MLPMPIAGPRRAAPRSGLWLKNTRFGIGDLCGRQRPDAAARRRRADVGWSQLPRLCAWPAASTALAGVFICAQTGSGDPLVGNPMLLSDVRRGGGRRHAARRRPRRRRRLDHRRLHADDRRQHPARAQRLRLLLDHRRRRDPAPRRARRLARRHSTLAGSSAAPGIRLARAGAPAACRRRSRRRQRACRRSAGADHRRRGAALPFLDAPRARSLRYALPAYVCFVLVVLVATQSVLGHAMLNLGLLELADRAVLVPRRSWRSARAR